MSEKRILPAFLLCIFFGMFGVHRFYVGKVGTGLLQLFTFGGAGIWMLVDLILNLTGSFTDKQRQKITKWTRFLALRRLAAGQRGLRGCSVCFRGCLELPPNSILFSSRTESARRGGP